jgi:hypothetical protein
MLTPGELAQEAGPDFQAVLARVVAYVQDVLR